MRNAVITKPRPLNPAVMAIYDLLYGSCTAIVQPKLLVLHCAIGFAMAIGPIGPFALSAFLLCTCGLSLTFKTYIPHVTMNYTDR